MIATVIAENADSPARLSASSAECADLRNPLFDVSSEFMREAGYQRPRHSVFINLRNRQQDQEPEMVAMLEPQTLAVDVETDQRLQLGENDQSNRAVRRWSSILAAKRQSLVDFPQKSLKNKKLLMRRRIRVCDASIFCAVVSILLVVCRAELLHAECIPKDSFLSVALVVLADIFTLALVYLVVYYHVTELKIAAIDTGTHDWIVSLTWQRALHCVLECFVCIICPFPNDCWVGWIALIDSRTITRVTVPLDVALSLPMFLRCYLLCRFMALHSRQFQDSATRSIAALNYITMNFQFVFRTLIDEHPLRLMVIFSACYCIIVAWVMTQCDRHSLVPESRYYLNNLWFVIVTYMGIGYGDLWVSSYAARAILIFTGIVGKVVYSVLIAVISRHLHLARSEIRVHNFVTDSKLSKQRKNAAAKVLQNLWFIHRLKKSYTWKDEGKLRRYQRQFLQAVADFRRIKYEQRTLAESRNSYVELAIAQREISDVVSKLQRGQRALNADLAKFSESFQTLNSLWQESGAKKQNDAS